MKRDEGISVLRVMAMFFIVICHICSYFNIIALAQFFNVGVPMFFMISGYLYGARKQLDNPIYFLYKRYLRLEIPALLWLTIVCISAAIKKQALPELHSAVFILLNLQGLNFIFSTINDYFIGPWFFTNIMCCYILLLCYLTIEKKHPGVEKIFSYGGLMPLLCFCLLALCHISTSGALAFFIGFTIKRRKLLEPPHRYGVLMGTIAFIAAVGLRLICRRFIDGTVIYDEIIAPGTHVVLAASILTIVKRLFYVFPKLLTGLAQTRLMKHLDKISIYVYISHDMLFLGTVCAVFSWPFPTFVNLALLFPLIIIFATILWSIGEAMIKGIDKAVDYLFI